MAKSKIVFAEVRAEMAKRSLSIGEIAGRTGMCKDTVSRKLGMRAPLHLEEAILIQRRCFPDRQLDELFRELFIPHDGE